MFQSARERLHELYARFRERFGERFAGLVLALLVEILIALLLLTLAGPKVFKQEDGQSAMSVFSLPAADEQQEDQSDETAAKQPQPTEEPQPKPQQQEAQAAPPPPPDRPKPPPQPTKEKSPPWIELSNTEMASSDIRSKSPPTPAKSAPSKPMYGPVAPPGMASDSGDTPQVGTAPNGAPLYAASWYREPYHDALAGFLSTATGPGWGLIACKTAPNYRVEDCQILDEYPEGSHIARAVQAAAFQFKVRPPRGGGSPQIGAWVRIRIDYGVSLK